MSRPGFVQNAELADQRFSHFYWKVGAIFLALAVNVTLFGLIPVLSGNNMGCEKKGCSIPVFIDVYKTPPISSPVHEKKREMKVTMKPKKIPIVPLHKSNPHQSRPKADIRIDSFQFDVNPRLETGLDIAVPAKNPQFPSMFSSREFGLGEVDQIPRVIRRVNPIYPYLARIRGITGKVVVKFLVDSNGYVKKPVILKAVPKGIFENTVIQALRKWKFKPGYWQGRPVATWVVLPIQFKLNG